MCTTIGHSPRTRTSDTVMAAAATPIFSAAGVGGRSRSHPLLLPITLPPLKPSISTLASPARSTRFFPRRSGSSVAAATAVESRKGKRMAVFDTEEGLAASLAEYMAGLAGKFAGERGAFTVVVSGGSLIKSLRKLVEDPYVGSIDWSKWHVFWVDERVVPKDHDDSNYKLAYDGFLSKVPIPAGQVYAINDALSAEGAAEDYVTCLKHLVRKNVIAKSSITGFPKFDVMLLGMGPDGHVASLFPGHPLVKESEKWVTYIKDSPKPPPERITFTLPVINSSAYVALVVTGAAKADVVRKVFGNEEASTSLLPVEMVSTVEGETTWFSDKDAASKL